MGLGINLIEAERERQIYREGWTKEHDDKHVNNELALAAACYAVPDVFSQGYWPPTWDLNWYKSTTRIRDLVKAGALIAAEIDRLQRIEIKHTREKLIPKVKKMVDDVFEKFGEEDDNILILSACYYPDDVRDTYEVDSPLDNINFNRASDYNNLYFPIGRNWDLGTWERDGKDEDKLDTLYEDYTEPICEALTQCFIDCCAEDYYRDYNSALNDYWHGVIGIMRDYKVVSFVIRKDGLLCDKESITQGYNKIIEQL